MCSHGLLGGYAPCKDPEGPHVKDIAEWAVAEYNKEGHHLTLIRVVKCESQVVSGVNYRLVLLTKDYTNNTEGEYETVVWEKAWEHFRKLIYFKPVNSVVGGYVPCEDPEGPHVKEIAEWAVAEYNKEGHHHLTLIRVVKCESQVVAGVNYRLVLLAKDHKHHERNYETVVWEKIWEHFRQLIYFKPLNVVVGGYSPCEDPEGPHVKEIAEWAVAEYNKEGHHLTLIRVIKCESQVVDGINYRLVLSAIDEKHHERNYETVVWEKIWEHFRKLIYFKPLLKC